MTTTKDILRLTAAAALALPLLAACGDDQQATEAPAETPATQAGEASPPPTTIEPPLSPAEPVGVAGDEGAGDTTDGVVEPEVGVGGQAGGSSTRATDVPPAGTPAPPPGTDPATPVEEAIRETDEAIEKVPEKQ